MTATTPPPAAERIEMIRTAEAAALDYLMAHGGRWIEGTNRLFLDDTKYEMAELIGVVLDVVAPLQGRPSREAVAQAIYSVNVEECERILGRNSVQPEFAALARDSRDLLLRKADIVLALWPSSPQPATAPLWCVHVRGPDDVVPVASYDDAVRLSDGLNWWWWSLPRFTENDPLISAIPALWDGTAEEHARGVAKLGTRGADYAVPTEDQVEAKRVAAFRLRVERSKPQPATADAEVQP